jgi:hypothetical protein
VNAVHYLIASIIGAVLGGVIAFITAVLTDSLLLSLIAFGGTIYLVGRVYFKNTGE